MYTLVDGKKAYFSSGSRKRNKNEPAVILIHGAGMDRTVWQLQTRNIAFMGYQVFAVDLPGHGRSEGPCLSSIEHMANWILSFIEASKLKQVAIIGHSMGALIAIETASRNPKRVDKLCLMGVAGKMPVHPDLLEAAKNDKSLASELIVYWGLGDKAQIGGHPQSGLWVHGANQTLLDNSSKGIIYQDLIACDQYQGSYIAAQKIECRSFFILGKEDKMTPPKKAQELIAAVKFSDVTVIKDCGHMMMSEKPNQVFSSLKYFFEVL